MNPLPLRVLGTGVYLPPEIRTNDWWPRSFVDAMLDHRAIDITTPSMKKRFDFPKVELVMKHMAAYEGDPFRGARERRVAAEGMRTSDMQSAAALDCLARAGCDARDVDFIIDYALPPDLVGPLNSGLVQRKIGAVNAMAFTVDSGCSSFLTHLSVAARYIATGARRVLCVLSLEHSRLMDASAPASPCLGDGACAILLGPGTEGSGLLGTFARNDGRMHNSVILAPVSGKPWYSAGEPSMIHSSDMRAGFESVLRTAEFAAEALGKAIAGAGLLEKDIDVFCCHQPVSWFGAVCQEAAGLTHARMIESFASYGSIGAASVLLNLHLAVMQGAVKKGSHVALFSNGAGFNHAAAVLRWE